MNVRGLHVYGGAIIACFGLSLVHTSLGFIGGGAFLVWLGLNWIK